MAYRDDLKKKPVRVGSIGTMDVNASDQIGPDETGEMMHKSDAARNRQLLTSLRVKEMIRRGEEPATDTDVEEAERQGYYDKRKSRFTKPQKGRN